MAQGSRAHSLPEPLADIAGEWMAIPEATAQVQQIYQRGLQVDRKAKLVSMELRQAKEELKQAREVVALALANSRSAARPLTGAAL